MLVGVVLPSRQLLAIPLVLLAQPRVLCCHAPQPLCKRTLVRGLVVLFTQARFARLECELDPLVAPERLSRRRNPHSDEDPLH